MERGRESQQKKWWSCRVLWYHLFPVRSTAITAATCFRAHEDNCYSRTPSPRVCSGCKHDATQITAFSEEIYSVEIGRGDPSITKTRELVRVIALIFF